MCLAVKDVNLSLREAIEKGYLFVEGDSPREFWEDMMSGIAIKYE